MLGFVVLRKFSWKVLSFISSVGHSVSSVFFLVFELLVPIGLEFMSKLGIVQLRLTFRPKFGSG